MPSWDFVVTKVRQIPSSLSPKLPEGHRVFNRQWEQLRRPCLLHDLLLGEHACHVPGGRPFSALTPGRVGFRSESLLGSTKN